MPDPLPNCGNCARVLRHRSGLAIAVTPRWALDDGHARAAGVTFPYGDTPDACSTNALGDALQTDQDEVLHRPAKNDRTMWLAFRCPPTRTSRGTQPRIRPSVNRKLWGKKPGLCKHARYVTDTLPWRGDHGFGRTTRTATAGDCHSHRGARIDNRRELVPGEVSGSAGVGRIHGRQPACLRKIPSAESDVMRPDGGRVPPVNCVASS